MRRFRAYKEITFSRRCSLSFSYTLNRNLIARASVPQIDQSGSGGRRVPKRTGRQSIEVHEPEGRGAKEYEKVRENRKETEQQRKQAEELFNHGL